MLITSHEISKLCATWFIPNIKKKLQTHTMAAAISAHKAASQTHFILESYIIQAGKIHGYTGLTAENSGTLWWWWQGLAKSTPCQSHTPR